MLTVIYDARCAGYAQPHHPERPARVLETVAYLRRQRPELAWSPPVSAGDVDLLRVHTPEHLLRLQEPADFDADTPALPAIAEHARRAAGAAVTAARLALGGTPAFSLMRPPGHHATADRAMGFCYLNSVVIAARAALAGPCGRVGIWDFDAHHGNGTEALVAGDERLWFGSVHQHPAYPGTGTDSFGNVTNRPVPPLAPRARHRQAAREALDAVLAFHPDLLVVSAGFDAFAGDPLTQLRLEADDFRTFGQWLADAAVPVAAVLEGGYSGELPRLVEAFLQGWMGG